MFYGLFWKQYSIIKLSTFFISVMSRLNRGHNSPSNATSLQFLWFYFIPNFYDLSDCCKGNFSIHCTFPASLQRSMLRNITESYCAVKQGKFVHSKYRRIYSSIQDSLLDLLNYFFLFHSGRNNHEKLGVIVKISNSSVCARTNKNKTWNQSKLNPFFLNLFDNWFLKQCSFEDIIFEVQYNELLTEICNL